MFFRNDISIAPSAHWIFMRPARSDVIHEVTTTPKKGSGEGVSPSRIESQIAFESTRYSKKEKKRKKGGRGQSGEK
jgi:hypothetical protein